MSKVAQYLQEHLLGEVTANLEVRRHFAHDASILQLVPAIVAYPRNENDVRKTVRFSGQLAERGRLLPITARGGGSSTSGAAVGSGVLLVFTAHMNRIITLNPKKKSISVEPGATFDKIEQALYTHGLFLPPYPASQHYATIGGGIATNVVGEKSLKYGPMANYVDRLRVVLANGEVIETGPLNQRELGKKLGLASFEGKIYRELDKLLEENAELIEQEKGRQQAKHTAVGYKLFDIKDKKNFDLTQLFVGSEGTLGIITEATLTTIKHVPAARMALISLNDLNELTEIQPKILALKPSICDMVNKQAIELIKRINPSQLGGVLENPGAAIHLFVEFDDAKESAQRQSLRNLEKAVQKSGAIFWAASKPEELDQIWKVRHAVTTILSHSHGYAKALPVAEDVCVPTAMLADFLQKAEDIYAKYGLTMAAWGSAGDGVIKMYPALNLASVGDRQKFFKLADAIYRLAIESGGSLSAAAGDGRLRAPFAFWQYSPEYYELIKQVKKIFDPHGILNPGVKTASLEDVKTLMRAEYNLGHHEHLPRS